MERTLYAVQESTPGPRWQGIYRHRAERYHGWFLQEGEAARPSYAVASGALRQHMPELVPTYERLVDLAGGGDLAARLLALWCPPPYLTGCSQAVWRGERSLLCRNYDYHPERWDGILLASEWTGRRVIGMLDSLWGVLDGINDAGLAVSLAFGGRPTVGRGFGMPLILRYVLETCGNVKEAVAALTRLPSHMSYNVTVLDARDQHRTVYVAPDRPAAVTRRALATNHQRVVEWEAFAHATASLDRERYLSTHLEDPAENPRAASCSDFSSRRCTRPISTTAGVPCTPPSTNRAPPVCPSTGTVPPCSNRLAISTRLRWRCRSPTSRANGFTHDPHRHQPHHRGDHRHPSGTRRQGAAQGDRRGPQGAAEVAQDDHGPAGRADACRGPYPA